MSFRYWRAIPNLRIIFLRSWTHGKVGQWSSWRVRLQAQRFRCHEWSHHNSIGWCPQASLHLTSTIPKNRRFSVSATIPTVRIFMVRHLVCTTAASWNSLTRRDNSNRLSSLTSCRLSISRDWITWLLRHEATKLPSAWASRTSRSWSVIMETRRQRWLSIPLVISSADRSLARPPRLYPSVSARCSKSASPFPSIVRMSLHLSIPRWIVSFRRARLADSPKVCLSALFPTTSPSA